MEIMYNINLKTYVGVYKILNDSEILFRNPIKHIWEKSEIWSFIPKKEWVKFLKFYEKLKNNPRAEYKAPKIYIGRKMGLKDNTVFYISDGYDKSLKSNIYNTYKEAEEAAKIYIYEDYYCSLTEEQKKEILKEKEIDYV